MSKSNQETEYPLTNYPASVLVHRPIDKSEPPNSRSRASFLHRHRQRNERAQEGRSDTTPLQIEPRTRILDRLSSFMSQAPLLSRSGSSQGAGSYGLTTTKEPPDQDGADNTNEQDRTQAKSSALGAGDASRRSHSSRHRKGSRSGSRDKRNGIGQASEGDEPGNTGEETINVDGDSSEEDPPDDSP